MATIMATSLRRTSGIALAWARGNASNGIDRAISTTTKNTALVGRTPLLVTASTASTINAVPQFHQQRRQASEGASTTAPRPFRVLGLQQIAIGGLDKSAMSSLWEGVLGVTKVGNYKSEKENVDEDILVLGKKDSLHAVEVDLMVPIDESKSPKVHIPPLNHIGLWIDDLPAAVLWMKDAGVRFAPGGVRPGAAGHDVTFIHPKGNEASPIGGAGVLIELVQAPTEVIDALGEGES